MLCMQNTQVRSLGLPGATPNTSGYSPKMQTKNSYCYHLNQCFSTFFWMWFPSNLGSLLNLFPSCGPPVLLLDFLIPKFHVVVLDDTTSNKSQVVTALGSIMRPYNPWLRNTDLHQFQASRLNVLDPLISIVIHHKNPSAINLTGFSSTRTRLLKKTIQL